MATPDMDVIKEIPGYKVILKAVLKSQIQQLVEQLATTTDEESVILTASVGDGTLSHLGSDSGKTFLEDHEDIKSQFLGFCLKRHHKQKQEKMEKERQEALARVAPVTPPRYGGMGGPRASYMPQRSPRFTSPRNQGPHPVALSRASTGALRNSGQGGARHEPYPTQRAPRRGSLSFDQGPGPRPNVGSGGQVIKVEPTDDEQSNQSAPGMTGSDTAQGSSEPSSPSVNQTGLQQSTEREDDAKSESSSSTIPNESSDLKQTDNVPPGGLSLGSDLSSLIPGVATTTSESVHDTSGMDPNVSVKLEAGDDGDMDLEITGVELGSRPGDPVMASSQDWAQQAMGGMPTGASGGPGDMTAQQGYMLRMSFCEDKKTVQPISRDMDSSVTLNRSVMRLLYEQMTSQSEFCDVTITFGDKENFEEMKAHSCVLVYSAYFESLYSSGLQEKEQGKVHIGIGKPECIKMALTYLYTGKIHLEFSKLKDILEVADYLQIDDLKADCNRYLRNTELTIKNCVPLCLLSGSYNIEFYSQALEFMRAHLPDVMDTPEAFELSPDSLLDIVSDPALSYVPRISLFNFIVKWVDLDPKERTKYFAELFSSLDLTKIPLKFLTNEVKSCPHVMSSPECLNKYGNIVQMLKKGIIKENSTIDVLFLVGGMDERDRFNKIVFVYLIQEDRWIELSRIPYTLDCTEVTCSLNCKDDALFIVERWRYEDTGGQIKVYKYDLNARNWSSHLTPFEDTDSVPSGSDVHSMFALKETNEFCIISEGFLPPSNVNSVVVCATYYDSELKNIISRTQIFKTKEDAAVSSCIADNRYICSLIFNPLDELNGRNTGQRFLVRDTKGRQVKGFQNFSRGSCRADEILPIGHEIYMCDFEADPGSQGETLVRFDLQKRKWLRSNGSMLLKRMRRMYARCSFGKKIYVVGGDTDDGPVNYADVFDPSEAKWEQIAPIPKPLACVVMCPGKISSEFHTCHANCPHCKVKKSLFDPASQSVTSEDLWSDDSDSEQGDCSIM